MAKPHLDITFCDNLKGFLLQNWLELEAAPSNTKMSDKLTGDLICCSSPEMTAARASVRVCDEVTDGSFKWQSVPRAGKTEKHFFINMTQEALQAAPD